jgi:hypothetical protein
MGVSTMAEDYTRKRLDMASRTVEATTALVNAIRTLKGLKEDLHEVGGGFEDSDFDRTGTDISHLNAWKANTLLNVVVPALDAAADAPIGDNGVTAREILLAVKRAS